MQNIQARISHLLKILAHADAPISVGELAKRLAVSRRTVFREIENIDSLLKPYRLSVSTIVGEGIYLTARTAAVRYLHELRAAKALLLRNEFQSERVDGLP